MYKKILCASLLALGAATLAYAEEEPTASTEPSYTNNFNPGFYLSGQLGMSNMHYGPKYTIPGNDVENYKFAGRASAGYAFSQFISTELGYTYYGRPKFKDALGTGLTEEITQQGLDLVLKATLPLDYGFGVYIKGGLAYVHRSTLNPGLSQFAKEDANSKITPVAGLGIVYWFLPHMALDLFWTKTLTVSNLPTSDFYGLGLIYKFNI